MIPQSAVDIGQAVRAGDLSAATVVEAALDRAAATAEFNIFTRLDAAGARAAAARVDAQVASGQDPGPLVGVPFAVKDLIDQAGLPNTCGGSFAPFTPAETATCVARLEAAGAIPLGRAGLHEFAFGFSSENHWFGPVRNPLDPSLSPGGSSGGSAAAVAAGIVPFAVGTDTGGSVRVPAALCGITGLKVTHGRVSLRGVYPLAPGLDTVGPLARSLADLDLVYRVMAGHDPQDPRSVAQPVAPPQPPRSVAGLRLAVPHPWVDTGYEPELETGFRAARDALRENGAVITDVTIPETAPPGMGMPSAYYEVAPIHRVRFEEDPDAYGPEVRGRIADALQVTAADYVAALEWRHRVRAALDACLGDHDAILTPTTAAVRKRIGETEIDLTTGPAHYRAPLSQFTSLVNNAGLPAVSLPIPGSGTPPVSLQLIGRGWDESGLLAIASGLVAAGLVH